MELSFKVTVKVVKSCNSILTMFNKTTTCLQYASSLTALAEIIAKLNGLSPEPRRLIGYPPQVMAHHHTQ